MVHDEYMIFTKTVFEQVFIIEPEPHVDYRGYFSRIYCQRDFKEMSFPIVQVNQSMSIRKGTIRGPHMQKPPHSERKVMQCIRGSIFDVVVDVRKDSTTFGRWIGNILSEKNKKMVYVPEGYMHGYQSLEDDTIVQYPVSTFYIKESVLGIRWDDPFYNINWPVDPVIVSEIDKSWPLYQS